MGPTLVKGPWLRGEAEAPTGTCPGCREWSLVFPHWQGHVAEPAGERPLVCKAPAQGTGKVSTESRRRTTWLRPRGWVSGWRGVLRAEGNQERPDVAEYYTGSGGGQGQAAKGKERGKNQALSKSALF